MMDHENNSGLFSEEETIQNCAPSAHDTGLNEEELRNMGVYSAEEFDEIRRNGPKYQVYAMAKKRRNEDISSGAEAGPECYCHMVRGKLCICLHYSM